MLVLMLGLAIKSNAQTLNSAGNWDNSAIWNAGNIGDLITENVSFNNNIGVVTVRSGFNYTVGDVAMNNGNTLTIASGGILNVGASGAGNNKNLQTGNTATIIVDGTLEIWGNLNIGNTLNLIVTGTLIIHGDISMGNGGTLNISGNVVVEGNFTGGNGTDVTVDGSLSIGGNINVGNGSNVGGSGTIDVGGSCTDGSSSFCGVSPMPTCAFLNTITANQAICNGSSAANLNGNAVGGSPAYTWQSSTTSATAGFSNATGTNNLQNYSPGAITVTTWYRRVVVQGGCTRISPAILITVIPATGWRGTSSSNWHTAANWCSNSVPIATTNVTITTGVPNQPTIGAAAVCNNLTITSGALVTINAANSLDIKGNYTNNGSFTYNTSTVTFTGTTPQTIGGSSNVEFHNLTINNSSASAPQITIDNSVTARNTLAMTAGRINLNGNTFTIGVSAAAPGTLTHAGAGTNGWMYGGSLRRFVANTAIAIGANAGFFPLGSASDFRPFFVSKNNIANSGGSITVSHNNATTTSNVSILDAGPAATITRRHDSNWSVTTSGITAGTWGLRGGGTGFGTIQELPDLRMSTTTGVVGAHAAATGTIADPRVNRTGLTFGQLANSFHVASIDAVNSPLPIKLLYLNTTQLETAIEVQWATTKEENFNYFVVEHSLNGVDFTELGEVAGAGYNTNTKQEYLFVHSSPFVGQNYYRLKAVDLDDSYEYFGPIAHIFSGSRQINIYPNPSNEGFIEVDINFYPSEGSHITILNTHGVEVISPGEASASSRIELGSLSPGIYLLKFSSREFNQTKKFIVK